MLSMPATLLAAKESEGTGTPSTLMATPDEIPTVCSFDTLEMPRTPVGTRPLMVPLSCTEGTRLFKSDRSATLALASACDDTTAAETGTSCSFSVRFWAVITISSSSVTLAAGLSPNASAHLDVPASTNTTLAAIR